jgi:hypothetical protein
MKRFIIFSVMVIGLFYNGLSQTKDQKPKSPKEDIKVNREYDEQGNLIRFDSTYTYNWSGDTTLINGKIPGNMDRFFTDHFKFFGDSSALDDSFFGDFNQLFAMPFSNKHDSMLLKNFGIDQLKFFNFDNDTIIGNFKDFDELFGEFKPDKKDSLSSGSNKSPAIASPHSIQEMMKIMEQHMQQMQKLQRKNFEKQQGWKEF